MSMHMHGYAHAWPHRPAPCRAATYRTEQRAQSPFRTLGFAIIPIHFNNNNTFYFNSNNTFRTLGFAGKFDMNGFDFGSLQGNLTIHGDQVHAAPRRATPRRTRAHTNGSRCRRSSRTSLSAIRTRSYQALQAQARTPASHSQACSHARIHGPPEAWQLLVDGGGRILNLLVAFDYFLLNYYRPAGHGQDLMAVIGVQNYV